MLIRTVLHFSLRINVDDASPNAVARVEEALGGRFREKDYHEISMREMYLLGMVIRFIPWRGIGLKPVYQLAGYTPVPLGVEGLERFSAIDLNQAIIELLQAKGAGTWHIPSTAEIHAEATTEASRAMEDEDLKVPDAWPTHS